MTDTSDDDIFADRKSHSLRIKRVTLNLMKPLTCTDEEREMVALALGHRQDHASRGLRRYSADFDPGEESRLQVFRRRQMVVLENLFDHLDRVPFYGLHLLGDQTGLTQYPTMTDVWNAVQEDQRAWAKLAEEVDMATPQSRLYLKLEKHH